MGQLHRAGDTSLSTNDRAKRERVATRARPVKRAASSLHERLEELQLSAGNTAVTGLVQQVQARHPAQRTALAQRSADNSYLRVAGDITSTFESGGDYGRLQTDDAGIISYGKHQATLGGGNLYVVVKEYTERSSAETAAALAAYLPRLKAKDATLADDKSLLGLLRQAAKDPGMHAAQDSVFKRKYWDKSAKTAKSAGVTSALGHALLYDTTIQGGAAYRLKEARAKVGGNVGDVVNGHKITEQEFLQAFVEARIAAAIRQSERNKRDGQKLVDQAKTEKDPAKAAALKKKGNRLIANGRAMLVSGTKTRGPTWKALVASGDLDLRGDASGMVKLVGKKSAVRGLKEGATVDGSTAATALPKAASKVADAPSSKAQPEPAAGARDDVAGLVAGALPPTMRTGSLSGLLAAAGTALGPALIQSIAAAGYRDVNKLTNIAFWLRHPELAGTKLDPRQPDFRQLSREWLTVREQVVAPALQAPPAAAGSRSGPHKAGDMGAKKAPTPGAVPAPAGPAPAGPQSEDTKAAAVAPAANGRSGPGPEPGPAGDAFVKDWAASTIDLLPPAERARFANIKWGWMDFPGTVKRHEDLTPAEVEAWRRDAALAERDIKGRRVFVGKHQDEAEQLFLALARNRPGGGERRVNIGPHAVLTKEAFQMAPQAFDTFVDDQLDPVPGQPGVQLHKEAGVKFAAMRAAAALDGVPLLINSAWRPRSSEQRAAKAAKNPKAVGSFSPHSLGLAVDLRLHVRRDPLTFTETSTGNFKNMLDMMRSPVYKWVYQRGAAFGFYQYRAEPWHWEYNPSGFKDRFFDKAPELEQKVAEAAAAEAARAEAKKKRRKRR
ncbi:MAG: chitosanase [Actinobacteria bacterium]|nr:chitosanase [Actinomycetota bacterium]